MTQRSSAKGKKRRKKPEKLEFVQDFIPIKDLRHGIIMAPMSEAHIGHLGEYYCKLVIEESRKLLDRPRKMKSSPRFQVLQGGAAAS